MAISKIADALEWAKQEENQPLIEAGSHFLKLAVQHLTRGNGSANGRVAKADGNHASIYSAPVQGVKDKNRTVQATLRGNSRPGAVVIDGIPFTNRQPLTSERRASAAGIVGAAGFRGKPFDPLDD